jgi:hypothetical protein
MEVMRNAHKILFGKLQGKKRPLGRPGRRWEYIRLYLRETGWEGVDWMHLTWDMDQ